LSLTIIPGLAATFDQGREFPHHAAVFCEDTRRFVDTKKSAAHRFETALGRGIDVRYIEKLAEFDYSPKSQLAR
jgi:hypothetical protein